MDLEYPKDERGKYKYLEGWNIVKGDGQLFRIPQLSKIQDTGLSVKITANHIFYDLLNDFNEDTRAEGKTIDEALAIALTTNPKFTVLPSDLLNTNTAYFVRENPVTSIFQKIIPRWGGELYRDNFNVAIKSRIGQDTGILISYGKNIKGFEQTLDYSTIATRIMPVGKDGLTIDLVNQGSKYLESPRINDYPFIITKIVEFKDVEDATELKNKALSLWGTIDLPLVNYKVNFVELSKTEEYKHLKVLQEVQLGDTVTIRHKEFNVDISARVIKTKKNVLTGRLEEIELGQFKENISGHINSLEGKINYTNEVISDVNEDLQGTKTIVFQNQEQISLKAQELQTNINNAKSELQGNINSTNSNVSNIDSRLSEAESKITPTAITNTVRQSTEYSTDMANVNLAIQTAQSTADSKATTSYVDNAANSAEANAKLYANLVAQAESDLAEAQAKAYADGVVTAEEQARIADAQAKLNEAKTYAENQATAAQTNATTYADAVAQAKADLAQTAANAYADNIITAEEQARIQQAASNLAAAQAYAESQASSAEANANYYTDTKKAELDTTINILVGRVTTAEEKITDYAIVQTVTESNTYKSFNLVPNKTAINTTRAALSINPLEAFNFVSGVIFNNNELVNANFGTSSLVYTADLQMANNELVTFDKPADRIETAETKIEQTANSISLVVKEDGTINGDALTAAINISSSKIEMSALNIDLSGLVTFTALGTPGATIIHGGVIFPETISFNVLKDKPFIPSEYTDSEALAAWVASGYATYIDGTGAYIGNIKANQLLIGGANGSISFNNLVDKPFIPSSAADVGAISSTYIDANGVFTPQVYATNINVSGGKITATQIDVNTLQTQITAVSQFVYFTGNPINGIGNMTGGSYVNYLGIVSNYGVYLNAPNVVTQNGIVATQEWVTTNVGSSTATFG